LRRIFPYFTRPLNPNKRRSLDFHIGLEPDIDKISSGDYKRSLRYLVRLVRGQRLALIKDLEKEMKQAAKTHQFEQAAQLRNQIMNLKELSRRIIFGDKESIDISKDQALSDLKKLFKLPNVPKRIEGYDISHLSGKNVVASMVVFKNGASSRADYRKFKITNQKNDDYAAMREVLIRRLKHLDDWGKPDLVVIDGGAGQLGAVSDLLEKEKIPYLGRSKAGDHGKNAKTQIITPLGRKGVDNTILAHNTHIVKLLARISEESHRFAISYHTSLRGKKQIKSALDDIPGIGPKTKAKLKKLGGVAKINAMSEAELAQHIGVAKTKAVKNVLY
jgi:excinuclease ABC subunit C